MQSMAQTQKPTDKPQHGGKRPGAGRPAKVTLPVRVNIYMSREQHTKLMERGGSAWLRSLIDAA